MKNIFCLLGLLTFSFWANAQEWSVGFRVAVFQCLTTGKKYEPLNGYIPASQFNIGELKLAFFPPEFVSERNLVKVKDRYKIAVKNFVLADSLKYFPHFDIGFFSVTDSIRPIKAWRLPVDSIITPSTELSRLGEILSIVPFAPAWEMNKDSVIINLDHVSGVTPVFGADNYYSLDVYFELVAAVTHYYILKQSASYIRVQYSKGDNVIFKEWDKNSHFDRFLPSLLYR